MAMRFAMLAAALAAAAPAAAQSAKPPAEADRTIIEADVIEGVSDLEVSGRGNAEIRRDDMTIFGESLRYNREFGRAEGEGGCACSAALTASSAAPVYNTLDNTGVFEPELSPRARAYGARQRRALEFLGPERYRFINGNYTTCRPGQEDWRLEASELELDFEEEEGTAVHPRLRFFDTTIVASPYAVFPIGDRRKTACSRRITPRPASAASRSEFRTTGTSRPSTTPRSPRFSWASAATS